MFIIFTNDFESIIYKKTDIHFTFHRPLGQVSKKRDVAVALPAYNTLKETSILTVKLHYLPNL